MLTIHSADLPLPIAVGDLYWAYRMQPSIFGDTNVLHLEIWRGRVTTLTACSTKELPYFATVALTHPSSAAPASVPANQIFHNYDTLLTRIPYRTTGVKLGCAP